MKLNSVIIADDSESCNISELCVLLKDSTKQLLDTFCLSQEDIYLAYSEYLSGSINKYNLSEKIAIINNGSFLCFWYGHGKNNSFIMGNEEIVTTTENYYLFSNALIYTFSCLNGNDLADALVDNKAKAFVGYTSYANCPYGIDDVTTKIVMSFISSFLCGKTVNEAKEDLESAYNQAVYDESLDPLQRPLFQTNRDNLVVKGNYDLKLCDLLIDTAS